jgi:ABC-type transporter Mla subunit MlaD
MSQMPRIPQAATSDDIMRVNDNLSVIFRALETQNELLRSLLAEVQKLGAAKVVGDDDAKSD